MKSSLAHFKTMPLFDQDSEVDLITVPQASEWASEYLDRKVSSSNISYLIQYGKINRHRTNGITLVSKQELSNYYDRYVKERERVWKDVLGQDINWHLSFDFLREKDTTKHLHRLHPYKGKFIPQLVEYFLDDHTDEFKNDIFFRPGDVVIDPFCGSGTTLVQANELGMHAVGIDISAFNTQISNVKTASHATHELLKEVLRLAGLLASETRNSAHTAFEAELQSELSKFNKQHFPTPDFKKSVHSRVVDEKTYAGGKAGVFSRIYDELVGKHSIQIRQSDTGTFMGRWFALPIRKEIEFLHKHIQRIGNKEIRRVLEIILTRTMRSCRATTHSDLGTLKEATWYPYYCRKHYKVCKPIFSIQPWWERYGKDTVTRIEAFSNVRTDTHQLCVQGDSRTANLTESLSDRSDFLSEAIKNKGAKGIFSSPPYVGMIGYHEQHAYAYELLGYGRKDNLEIGPLSHGQGTTARKTYTHSIAKVLQNCRRFMTQDFHVFLVANDKHNLYPTIADLADMRIVNAYRRPVLNRTERNKGAYSESIFHMRTR